MHYIMTSYEMTSYEMTTLNTIAVKLEAGGG